MYADEHTYMYIYALLHIHVVCMYGGVHEFIYYVTSTRKLSVTTYQSKTEK